LENNLGLLGIKEGLLGIYGGLMENNLGLLEIKEGLLGIYGGLVGRYGERGLQEGCNMKRKRGFFYMNSAKYKRFGKIFTQVLQGIKELRDFF